MECGECETTIDSDEWFCSYCGTKRGNCPQCGTEYAESSGHQGNAPRECPSCGLPRKAACSECEEIIDATATVCPNCGADAGEEARSRIDKNKKRAAIFGIGIPIGVWVVASGLPSILTWLIWLPLASMGVISGLWYRHKMNEYQNKLQIISPSEFDIAEKKHESYNHRQKRKEKERWHKKLKKQLEQERRKREKKERTVVDMNCPKCGQDWTIIKSEVGDWYHEHGVDMIGFTNLSDIEVQCSSCNHIRHVQSQ